MGLDIYHYKLQTEMVKGGFIDCDLATWEKRCNVPIAVFKDYICDVQDWDFMGTVVLAKSKNEFERMIRDSYIQYKYIGVVIGDSKEEVLDAALALGRKVDAKAEIMPDVYLYNQCDDNEINIGTFEYKKGFFMETEGTQHRGMAHQFYKNFRGYEYWGLKTDFEKAFDLVGEDRFTKDNAEENNAFLKDSFKRDFIDNYEFGRSLLNPSY